MAVFRAWNGVLVGLVVVGSSRGWAQASCTTCDPDTTREDVVIDARNGKTSGGRVRDADEVVRVFLINKNPFRYRYRFVTKTISIESQSFAPLLKGVGLPVVKAESVTTSPPSPIDKQSTCSDPHIADAKELDRLLSVFAHHTDSTLNDAIADDRQRLSPLFAGVMGRLEAPVLYDTAHAFRIAVSTFNPDTVAFRVSLDSIGKLVPALRVAARQIPDIPGSCRDERNHMFRHADSTDGLVAHLRPSLANLRTRAFAYARVAAAVDAADSAGTPYFDTLTVGPFTKGTLVTVRVEYTSILDPGRVENLGTLRLTFGAPPVVSIAGGLAVAWLERVQFGTALALQRDAQGNPIPSDTLGNFKSQRVISVTERSPLRVSPMLTLHARIAPIPNALAAYATLGSTVKSGDQGVDPEWLLGASIGTFDQAFFATIGVYVGRVQGLSGGYREGDPVPTQLTDPPVRRSYRGGFAIMLSYHL